MKHDTKPDNIIRQEIDAELSFLESRPSLHCDIMSQIKGVRKRGIAMRKRREHREKRSNKYLDLGLMIPRKIVFLAVFLFLLMSVTAVAATLIPSISQWLLSRDDAERLGDPIIRERSIASIQVDDVTITATEAVSDGKSYLCNVKVSSTDTRIEPYNGFLSDIEGGDMTNQETKSVVYVNIRVLCGTSSNEIYTTEYDDTGSLYILCEGFGDIKPSDAMTIIITMNRNGIIEHGEMTVPIDQFWISKKCQLRSPLRLGDTGYVVEKLTLEKTELRTYIEREVLLDDQPLSIALKTPTVILVDGEGNELTYYWSYNDGISFPLTWQVWSEDRTELLFEKELSVDEFVEVE